jgi:hypothetical protein
VLYALGRSRRRAVRVDLLGPFWQPWTAALLLVPITGAPDSPGTMGSSSNNDDDDELDQVLYEVV